MKAESSEARRSVTGDDARRLSFVSFIIAANVDEYTSLHGAA